jgi:hypothetical protein
LAVGIIYKETGRFHISLMCGGYHSFSACGHKPYANNVQGQGTISDYENTIKMREKIVSFASVILG